MMFLKAFQSFKTIRLKSFEVSLIESSAYLSTPLY